MKPRFLAGLALTFVLACPLTAAAATRSGPSLTLAAAPGYRLAVTGTHWPSGAVLSLLTQIDAHREIVRLQATNRGTFLVGITANDPCGFVRFEAADALGHRVDLRGPQYVCSSSIRTPRFRFTVLVGKRIPSHRVSIFEPSSARGPVELDVGDRIYVWQPGEMRAAFVPHADASYLQLQRQGRTADQDCSGIPAPTPAQCNAGSYWEWIALQAGRTMIDLSPACRQARPACAMPDMVIDVRIDE